MTDFKSDLDTTPPTPEMITFADAFVALDLFYHSAVNSQGFRCSEALALRYSTCRNAYLTLNSVFKDLRDILGRKGADPPLLKWSLHCCQQEDWACLARNLKELGMLQGQIKFKLKVWKDRHELDDIKENTLIKMYSGDRDKVRQVLSSIKSESKRRGQRWESKFWEISTDEPEDLRDNFSIVENCSDQIAAIIKALHALSDWGACKIKNSKAKEKLEITPLGLFPKEEDAEGSAAIDKQLKHSWILFEDIVLKYKDDLQDLKLIKNGGSRTVHGLGINGLPTEIHYNLENATVGLPCFIKHFLVMEHRLCDKILKTFRLNIPKQNMPVPFIIDLTPQISLSDDDSDIDKIKASTIQYHQKRSDPVQIAFLNITFPMELIDYRSFNYKEENIPEKISELIQKAIELAKSAGAAAIVLPEYFIPRGPYLRNIIDCARKKDLALIGGLVGRYDSSGNFHNEAVIMLSQAGQREMFQAKHRFSNEETPSLVSDKEHFIFKDTTIGTFAVVICSDYLEADIINSIRKEERDLDLLIVCCTNPRPDIFLRIASGDAYRLYANIIIVNQHPNILPKHKDPYNGSACFAPITDDKPAAAPSDAGADADNGTRPAFCNKIDPALISDQLNFQGQSVSLYMFTIDIDLLRNKKKEKPTSPGMHVPHARRALLPKKVSES